MTLRWLILLTVLFGFAGCSYEREEREVGHVGAARRDPFLAAGRLLAERGYSVSNATRFGRGPGVQGTLITPAQSFVNYGMTDHVLDWVRRGGHLVVFLRDGEAFRNDWGTFSLKDLQEPDPEVRRLLDALGVAAVVNAETDAKGELLDREVQFKSPAYFTWKDDEVPELDFVIGPEDKPAAASYSEGEGNVTIIASAKPFRNRYIGEADNAWAFWLLVGHVETTAIWFLQGIRISFFGMLWDYGWMALIPLLVLIAVWLWRNLPRFGPLRQAPEESNRDFAGHLRVLGAFQWRHRQTPRLLAPLRENIIRAATRRGWTPAQHEFSEHVANVAGLAPNRVDVAMQSDPREPNAFLAVVQDLQKIATALRA